MIIMYIETKLFNMTKIAYQNAYAPYSNFKVGASILLQNKEILIGSNIENSSYGLTMCAERNVIFNAYSKGFRKNDIVKIVIISDNDYTIPCGACLQVMSELLLESTEIILLAKHKELVHKKYTIKQFLPYGFKIQTSK